MLLEHYYPLICNINMHFFMKYFIINLVSHRYKLIIQINLKPKKMNKTSFYEYSDTLQVLSSLHLKIAYRSHGQSNMFHVVRPSHKLRLN